MCATWNKEYDPDLIAKKLEAIRVYDDQGNHGGFQGPYEDCVSVLHSSLKFSDGIPQTDRSRIIALSIREVAIAGNISAKVLLREISKQENSYLRLPIKKLVLVTSLSIGHDRTLNNALVDGAAIRFTPRLPRRFDQGPIMQLANSYVFGPLPKDYCAVRVSVTGRSEHEAVEKAFNAVDLLRGIWNLGLNRSRGLSYRSSNRRPMNLILPGPLHTLHDPDGKLASAEDLWYEPEYIGPVELFRMRNGIAQLRNFEKSLRRQLAAVQYRKRIQNAIKRYCRALDSRDFPKAFLDLWSVLEGLTDSFTGNYDVTIRRTASLFDEADFHKQVLKHLRHFRNRAVHAGEGREEIETLLFQLRRYVQELIMFHATNDLRFERFEEACEFLDLPTDTKVLQQRKQLLRKALKFRR
jgi:hypothetical protein